MGKRLALDKKMYKTSFILSLNKQNLSRKDLDRFCKRNKPSLKSLSTQCSTILGGIGSIQF